jgi:pimeloyl-ACP methyl ester carboxylesterase
MAPMDLRRPCTTLLATAVLALASGCGGARGSDPGAGAVGGSPGANVTEPAGTEATAARTTTAATAPTSAASSSSDTPTAVGPPPTFTPGPCPATTGDDPDPHRVRCGTVDVPVRHADPAGPRLSLAVAVITPPAPADGAAPLVYLAGGPGYAATPLVPRLLEAPLVTDRETILVDHRGTGASQPSLGCPEVDDLALAQLAMDEDDLAWRALQADAVARCRDRLVAAGVDLGAFGYVEIAADLADVRRALGHPSWDLYGISNGGRIALEVLRRYPAGVRSVVLDAAVAPQDSLIGEQWPNAQRAFDVLFVGCASDPGCAAAHPDLGATFADLVTRGATDPPVVSITDPVTGEPVTVRLDDELVLRSLRGALYDTELIPLLPQLIGELAAGRGVEEVAALIVGERDLPGEFSTGMGLSVECQDEVAFLPADVFERQARELPLLAEVILDEQRLDECAIWDLGRGNPSVEEPVTSDVPALVLVGEYDPVHPRAMSEAIAAGLSHSTLVELPGVGHGAVRASDCATTMMRAFLEDPAAPVDVSCIDAMGGPAWLVP